MIVCEKNLTSSIGLIFLAENTLLKEYASINKNLAKKKVEVNSKLRGPASPPQPLG